MYYALWVKKKDRDKCLLFTEHEIHTATMRAKRNKEDIPERTGILSSIKRWILNTGIAVWE